VRGLSRERYSLSFVIHFARLENTRMLYLANIETRDCAFLHMTGGDAKASNSSSSACGKD